jgi:hypothetical protein
MRSASLHYVWSGQVLPSIAYPSFSRQLLKNNGSLRWLRQCTLLHLEPAQPEKVNLYSTSALENSYTSSASILRSRLAASNSAIKTVADHHIEGLRERNFHDRERPQV